MDPISDMITRINNATARKVSTLTLPSSRLKQSVAEALTRAGYLTATEKKGKRVKKYLELAFSEEKPLGKLVRVSKPSRRVYMGASQIRRAPMGYGLQVLTTPWGVMTGNEARKQKVGGEVLFEII